MKKFLQILIVFCLTMSSSFAIEDVVDLQTNEKTLKEKLNDIYHLEVEQIEKSVTLLGFIRDWRIEGKLLPQYWRGKQRDRKSVG